MLLLLQQLPWAFRERVPQTAIEQHVATHAGWRLDKIVNTLCAISTRKGALRPTVSSSHRRELTYIRSGAGMVAERARACSCAQAERLGSGGKPRGKAVP